jgi:hypothetical protein
MGNFFAAETDTARESVKALYFNNSRAVSTIHQAAGRNYFKELNAQK